MPLSPFGTCVPPPLAGEALAFRDVFQQTQIGFIENETSLPRALPLGELARQRLRGQARQNKTRKHSDTMSLTNRACIAVFFAFCQHPCPLRHGFAVPPCPLLALSCHLPRPGESFKVRGLGSPRNVSGFAKGSPFGKDFPRSGENGKAKKGNSWPRSGLRGQAAFYFSYRIVTLRAWACRPSRSAKSAMRGATSPSASRV